MQDRFARGFVAGLMAGVPTLVFNMAVYYLNLSTLRWADFISLFTIGRRPVGLGETLYSMVLIYLFLSFLGILFAYLLPQISSRNYVLKGWVFGLAIWFVTYAIAQLSGIPELAVIPLKTAIANVAGASIWGVSLSLALKWLDGRVKV